MIETVRERILVLVKTYPVPSSTYTELVCVAGMTEDGDWRRLYPIPFRSLPWEDRFRKYDWIEVETNSKSDDTRPESRRPNLDSIKLLQHATTNNEWVQRRHWVDKLGNSTIRKLVRNGASLGVVAPSQIVDMEIKEVSHEWSQEDAGKLNQLSLVARNGRPLRKVPYEFRLVFRSDDDDVPRRALITDWEIVRRYWRMFDDYGMSPVKAANEVRDHYLRFFDRTRYDTRLFMGTTLPYNTWIVVGIYCPPKLRQDVLL